jgi:hypothetical protein
VVLVTTEPAAAGLPGFSSEPPQPVANVTERAVAAAAAAVMGPTRELKNGTSRRLTSR